MELGERLKELEASQGKTYEQIVAETAEKVKELQDLTKNIEDLRRRDENIKKSLLNLEQLKALNDKMTRHDLTLTRLDSFIEQSIRLGELGFTTKAAELLASELAKIGLDAKSAAATLANLLSRYDSLEEAVAKLLAEKSRLQQDAETKRAQQEGITKQLDALREQINKFKSLTEEAENLHQKRLNQLEAEYTSKREEHEALHEGRISKLDKQYGGKKAVLKAEVQDLEKKRNALTNMIQELNSEDKAVRTSLGEAETALKNIEEKMAKTRPLTALASLMEEPRSPIESTILLKATLGFVEGLKTHIAADPQVISNPQKLKLQLEEMSRTVAGEARLAAQKA